MMLPLLLALCLSSPPSFSAEDSTLSERRPNPLKRCIEALYAKGLRADSTPKELEKAAQVVLNSSGYQSKRDLVERLFKLGARKRHNLDSLLTELGLYVSHIIASDALEKKPATRKRKREESSSSSSSSSSFSNSSSCSSKDKSSAHKKPTPPQKKKARTYKSRTTVMDQITQSGLTVRSTNANIDALIEVLLEDQTPMALSATLRVLSTEHDNELLKKIRDRLNTYIKKPITPQPRIVKIHMAPPPEAASPLSPPALQLTNTSDFLNFDPDMFLE